MKKLILFTIFILSLTSTTHFMQNAYGTDAYGENLIGKTAPDFSGKLWLNSPPRNLSNLKGKIVLLDFWDYTCVNSLRTLPYLKEWHDRYNQYGLVIIGIHGPEFEFARDSENVKEALGALGIKYPIVIDNEKEIWGAYDNLFWPRKILIDQSGTVILDHVGEGRYTGIEKEIQSLIKQQHPDTKFPEIMQPIRDTDVDGIKCYPTTPELYAGFQRGVLGNKEGYHENTPFDYKDPGKYSDGKIYLNGKWFATHESLRHHGSTPTITDYIGIKYHAVEVNAVFKSEDGEPVKVFIAQDGKPLTEENKGSDVVIDDNSDSYVLVTSGKMYNLVNTKGYGNHVLHIFTQADGLSLYAFTFGSCRAPNSTIMPSWLQRLE